MRRRCEEGATSRSFFSGIRPGHGGVQPGPGVPPGAVGCPWLCVTSFTGRPPGTPSAAREALEVVPASLVAVFHGGARAQHNWIACIPKVPAVRGHHLFTYCSAAWVLPAVLPLRGTRSPGSGSLADPAGLPSTAFLVTLLELRMLVVDVQSPDLVALSIQGHRSQSWRPELSATRLGR